MPFLTCALACAGVWAAYSFPYRPYCSKHTVTNNNWLFRLFSAPFRGAKWAEWLECNLQYTIPWF